jgi:hypothetical protein
LKKPLDAASKAPSSSPQRRRSAMSQRYKIINLELTYPADGSPIRFLVKLPDEPAQSTDDPLQLFVCLDVRPPFNNLDLLTVVGAAATTNQKDWFALELGAKRSPVTGRDLEITLDRVPLLGSHEIVVLEWSPARLKLSAVARRNFDIVSVTPAPPPPPPETKDLVEIINERGSLPVSLRTGAAQTVSSEEVHWIRILAASKALAYDVYRKYVKDHFCPEPNETQRGRHAWSGVRAYERLRDVTESFVHSTCDKIPMEFIDAAIAEALTRLDRQPNVDKSKVDEAVPEDLRVAGARLPLVAEAYRIACLEQFDWCGIELIWSHWMEAGMLVQTMNTIARRFQNLRVGRGRDPLANFEIAPLRPLNHLIFGYVQNDSRLSVLRRAYEYRHQYGIHLHGKAVPYVHAADNRSKFIESFHNLLLRCSQLYRQIDDLTVNADAFPVLNSIKETHFLLSMGYHNQAGDLPQVARGEMLLEQWLLGTTEMGDFLHARPMTAYPEPWMDRVDAMKEIQGWIDTSIVHFRDLAITSEILVQSVRHGGWANQNDAGVARTWAVLFRPYAQVYLHAYRAVTGVELTSDSGNPRHALLRAAPPAEHLERRYLQQTGRTPL